MKKRMERRENLNKLVILTLQKTDIELRARQLYECIKYDQPDIFREEKVRGFRSFVKIINSFKDVKAVGVGVKKYIIEK